MAASRSSAPASIVTRYVGSSTCRVARTACVTLPGHLAHAAPLVGDAREGEEQVGEPVEVDDDELGDLGLGLQLDDPTFGAAADGTCDVQRRCFGRAAGHDERAQRLELGVAVVDRVLEVRDASVVDPRLVDMLAHLVA